MSVTPNMNITLATPEVTLGPLWAQILNTGFEVVDSHDHTTGNGVLITPAAIDINDSVDFNGHLLFDLLALGIASQGSTQLGTLGSVQNVAGNLYWINNAGQAVQITSGSSIITPGSGAITYADAGASPRSVIAGDAQRVLGADTNSAFVFNLPAATTAMFFMVKDVTGLAGTNNISITPNGTDTVEGVNSAYLGNTNYGSWGLVSDGISAWYVV